MTGNARRAGPSEPLITLFLAAMMTASMVVLVSMKQAGPAVANATSPSPLPDTHCNPPPPSTHAHAASPQHTQTHTHTHTHTQTHKQSRFLWCAACTPRGSGLQWYASGMPVCMWIGHETPFNVCRTVGVWGNLCILCCDGVVVPQPPTQTPTHCTPTPTLQTPPPQTHPL